MTNSYLEKEIDKKYEEIKVTLSELDANLKLTAENASRKTIVVNNNSLKYLEKYGFNVIKRGGVMNLNLEVGGKLKGKIDAEKH